jgi:hypothetical protein
MSIFPRATEILELGITLATCSRQISLGIRLKRGAADARLARDRGLAELEFLAALGDLLPYRG